MGQTSPTSLRMPADALSRSDVLSVGEQRRRAVAEPPGLPPTRPARSR